MSFLQEMKMKWWQHHWLNSQLKYSDINVTGIITRLKNGYFEVSPCNKISQLYGIHPHNFLVSQPNALTCFVYVTHICRNTITLKQIDLHLCFRNKVYGMKLCHSVPMTLNIDTIVIQPGNDKTCDMKAHKIY